MLLPGGQMNPDALRLEERVIELVEDFDEAEKPIAAICHGPWLLIEADIVDGRTVTGSPSIHTDLENAGGTVVEGADPAELPKARKNAVELDGTRRAHLRDGGAMVRFLAWLDREAPAGTGHAQPTFRCRHCGAPMLILETLARVPHIRGPPVLGAHS